MFSRQSCNLSNIFIKSEMVAPIILTFICPFSFLCICWFPPRDSTSKLGHICAAQLRSCHEGCGGTRLSPAQPRPAGLLCRGTRMLVAEAARAQVWISSLHWQTLPGVRHVKDGAISFPRGTKKGSIDLLAQEPQYSSRVPVL